MNGLVVGALMALSMMQQTDTTFAVNGAELLSVETLGGSIVVDVWDRDEIRVQAEHSTRTFVDIDQHRDQIEISGEARRGPANLVDFHLTVPRTLALELDANYADITVNGSDAAIEAETVQGDITVRGGRAQIRLSNTIGNIDVEGANGTIEIESSAANIRIANSGGEIYAETAGGAVVLEDVTATSVDIGSTGGRVHYDGTFDPAGTYFFGGHGGSVTIVVPDGAGISFNLATVHGRITNNLSGTVESLPGGERHSFEVGGGGALVEAETYGGSIRIVRKGSEGSDAPQMEDLDRHRMGDFGEWDLDLDLDLDDILQGHFEFDWEDLTRGRGVALAPQTVAAIANQARASVTQVVPVAVGSVVNRAIRHSLAIRHEVQAATIRR